MSILRHLPGSAATGLVVVGWLAALTLAPASGAAAAQTSGCYGGSPNGQCEPGMGESCHSCPADCGRCRSEPEEPGNPCDNDAVCEADRGETPINCGDCASVCGDQICAPHEVDSCAADCPLTLTCGDGVCSALESFSTCPLDCDPPTRTPTLTATPSATATPQATDTPTTPPPTDTDTPEPLAPTATDTPVTRQPPAAPTSTPTPAPAGRPVCRVVGLAEIDRRAARAFVQASGGYSAPIWLICEEPPDEVCLPADPILRLAADDLPAVQLLDCGITGKCRSLAATALEETEVCWQSGDGGGPRCNPGCSFARAAEDQPALPPNSLPPLMLACAAGGALLLLAVLLVVRRRREPDSEAVEDDSSPESG